MTRITGCHPNARGKKPPKVFTSSIMTKAGRTGRAATGVAAVALAACAVLAGITGSAEATTGPPLTTAQVKAPHALTSVPSRTEVTATSAYNSNNVKTIAKDCPAGLRVVGTGYFIKA